MSSAAYIKLDPDPDEGPSITLAEWEEFCAEHEIVHSPNTVGGNVYYQGGHSGVQITFGHSRRGVHEHVAAARGGIEKPPDEARKIVVETFSVYVGGNIGPVVPLALAIWQKWGGELSADVEIRNLIVGAQRVLA